MTGTNPHHGGDAVRPSILPRGLRVVTESLPAVRSAAVGIWASVGSRDEDLDHAGATHYLEHLLFKGTSKRTALEISAAMDAVGGELNAFTGKEYTCYYARVLDADLPLAIDVLADMVTDSLIEPKDVDAERGVILEEIAMNEDEPSDTVHEAFAAQLFGDTPLGRPILGTVASINEITRDQIADHYAARYTPPDLVVAVAGNVNHDVVTRQVREAFGAARTGDAAPTPPRLSGPDPSLAAGPRPRPGPRPPPHAHPGARVCRAGPHRRGQVRARGAQRGPGRRHVLAAVPGGAGEARAGLLGVQLRVAAFRHRHVGHLHRLPAGQGRRGAGDLPGGDRQGHLRRPDRRRTGPGQGPAARVAGPRPGGPVVTDEPAWQVGTGVRAA